MILCAWFIVRYQSVSVDDARVSADIIALSSAHSGAIAEVLVQSGQSIVKNQILIRLDPEKVKFQLDRQRSLTQSLHSEYLQLQSIVQATSSETEQGILEAQVELNAAKSTHEAESAQLRVMEADLKRSAQLLNSNLTTATEHDAVLGRRDAQLWRTRASADQVKVNEHRLNSEQQGWTRLEAIEYEVMAAKDSYQAAQAEYSRLEIVLQEQDIRSPIDGVVDRIFIKVGERVFPGQRLMAVHNPEDIWIDINIKETDLSYVTAGKPVTVTVDAWPDREFDARVTKVYHAANSEFSVLPSTNPSGTFTKVTQRVKARVDLVEAAGVDLKPGMMVIANIDKGAKAVAQPTQ